MSAPVAIDILLVPPCGTPEIAGGIRLAKRMFQEL